MAQYEITFNCDGYYSQGQLAVLAKMPLASELEKFQPVEIFIAPEGCKSIPDNLCTKDGFHRCKWRRDFIGLCPERAETLPYSILAKRRQYGLRHRIALTIHASMGQDLPSFETSVTESGENTDFNLWDRAQVVVLCLGQISVKI
jgi:hypothetical protein